MYFIDNLSQQDIARELNFSRSKVSRLLQEAKDKGIVEIKIATPISRCFELERSIEDLYGVSEAIVIPVYSTKEENILKSLGKAGADFLTRYVQKGMTVGISMGKTLYEVANALNVQEKISCNVVSIIGGNWPGIRSELDANHLCLRVAQGLGGTAFPLNAPSFVADKQLKSRIVQDPMIQEVFNKALNADVTVVSVGAAISAYSQILSQEEMANLQEKGVVGEIGYWFFNTAGVGIGADIYERVVGPNIHEIRSQSKLVLVAGGEHKQKAIATTLTSKWVDTLITDERVATYLIQSASS